jgi:MFS family permease
MNESRSENKSNHKSLSKLMLPNKNILFINSRFFRLWVGQLFSQSCNRMYQIALLWWILSNYTENTGKISAVFLILGALPAIVLVKWIGSFVDQHPSKQILISADFFALSITFLIALLSAFNFFNLTWIFISALSLALCQSYYDPTLFKALSELVEKKEIEQGVAFLSSTQSVSNLGGAVLGALFIEKVGITGVALLSGIGYSIAFLCNLSIQFKTAISLASAGSSTSLPKTSENIEVFFNQFPLIRNLLLGFGAINFFSMPTLVILPLFVQRSLQGNATTLSALEACLWLGLIVGTFLSYQIQCTQNPIKVGVCALSMMGVFLSLPGFFPHFLLTLFALFLAGTCLGINNTKFISYFQAQVPEKIKGSFFAHLQALIGFTTPMAYFVFGVGADLISPTSLWIIEGLGVLLISLYFFKLSTLPFQLLPKESP